MYLSHLSLLVHDYDEAITFFTQKLSFELEEDTVLSDTKRWVKVKPPGNGGASLLLAKAADDRQQASVGNQTGGRVFLFLHTDEFDRYYQQLVSNDVRIVREPSSESYGRVAVFADLYGNLWDLIEPPQQRTATINQQSSISNHAG